MRTRRNIDIVHYELDSSGKPVSINYYPGAIQGKVWANQQNVYVMITCYIQKFITFFTMNNISFRFQSTETESDRYIIEWMCCVY